MFRLLQRPSQLPYVVQIVITMFHVSQVAIHLDGPVWRSQVFGQIPTTNTALPKSCSIIASVQQLLWPQFSKPLQHVSGHLKNAHKACVLWAPTTLLTGGVKGGMYIIGALFQPASVVMSLSEFPGACKRPVFQCLALSHIKFHSGPFTFDHLESLLKCFGDAKLNLCEPAQSLSRR